MKKLITLLLILFSFTTLKAQKNLVYNQTLNINLNSENGYTQTVPVGKTWKITSWASRGNSNLFIKSSSSAPYLPMHFPFWLSEGKQINTSISGEIFVSILEFNITEILE